MMMVVVVVFEFCLTSNYWAMLKKPPSLLGLWLFIWPVEINMASLLVPLLRRNEEKQARPLALTSWHPSDEPLQSPIRNQLHWSSVSTGHVFSWEHFYMFWEHLNLLVDSRSNRMSPNLIIQFAISCILSVPLLPFVRKATSMKVKYNVRFLSLGRLFIYVTIPLLSFSTTVFRFPFL